MSNQNYISATIPPAIVTEVQNHLTAAIAALQPYGISLSKDERITLFKMGDGSTNVADKIAGYMVSNPEYIPHYISKASFDQDYTIPQQLGNARNLSEQLFQLLDDTIMAAGSDVMDAGLSYYHSVRSAAQDGAPGARAIYDDLKTRFPGRKGSKAPGGNS